MGKLKAKEEVRSQEWVLANESKGRIKKFEMTFKHDDKDISSRGTDILKWEKEIEENLNGEEYLVIMCF